MELGGNGAALARIHELEQQLQQSHAKLQKADNDKKKLREHVALLKEKAINSIALVEEQLALQREHAQLQQQYSQACAAVADLQQKAQQAAHQQAPQAAKEAAERTPEQRYNALLKDKQRTEKQLQATEQKLKTAVKAAEQARMQQQAAQARMDTLQHQLQELKQAVWLLQQQKSQQQQQQQQQQQPLLQQQGQQQLSCKLQQLEARVCSLQEADVEIDAGDLYLDLQRSVLEVLTAQVNSKLEGLQHSLQQLQQQQVRMPAAAGGGVCSGCSLERPATQHELQQLQQQVDALAAQQQQWHVLLRKALPGSNALAAPAAAAAAGGRCGQQHEPGESCCNRSCQHQVAAGSSGPSREPSPAAPDAAAKVLLLATRAAAAGTAVPLPPAASAQYAAPTAAAAASSRALGSSSMFGTTLLQVGGTTSSYGEEQQYPAASEMRLAQAASPSIGSHMVAPKATQQQRQQQQQQQQLAGQKRPRQQEDQETDEEEGDEEQEDDPWDQFYEPSSMQLQLPSELQGQQQQQQQGGSSPGRSAAAAFPAGDAGAADEPQQPPAKQPRLEAQEGQPNMQQQDTMQARRTCLDSQLRRVRDQHGAAAAVAEQLAAAVLAAEVSVVCLEEAFVESFLQDAAPAYAVEQLQQLIASFQQQQQQPGQVSHSCGAVLAEQPQLQCQLYCAGWAAASPSRAATVLQAHHRLADCACRLSDLLQQQQQQVPGAVQALCSSGNRTNKQHGSSVWQWPGAAECWQAACAAAGSSPPGSIEEDAAPGAMAAAGATPTGPRSRHASAHLLGDSRDSPKFVRRLAGWLSSVCSAHAALHSAEVGALAYQQQQQQPVKLQRSTAQACAASAAAAQLLRAAGDVYCYQQLLTSLLGMAAERMQQPAGGGSLNSPDSDSAAAAAAAAAAAEAAGCTSLSVQRLAQEGQHKLALACLVAAATSWPEALRLAHVAATGLTAGVSSELNLQLTEPDSCCEACGGGSSSSSSSHSSSCWVWQCLVWDPVLLAIRSCMHFVAAGTATQAASPRAAAAAAAVEHVVQEEDVLSKALQMVLQLAPAADGVDGAACSGFTPAGDAVGIAAACPAVLPTPQDLLAQLLSLVQLLLQKQHAGLPGGCLVAADSAVSAAAAGLYVAIGLVVQLVPPDAAKSSVWALKAAMAGVHLSGVPAILRKLLR